jgi:hypothetical protein
MKFVKYGSVAVAPVMLGRVGLRSMPSALSWWSFFHILTELFDFHSNDISLLVKGYC